MSSWRECKLGDVIEIIGGGTPKTSISEYWNGNIPWLSVVDFNTGKKYVSKTEKTITEQGLKNSSTKLLQKNDIIISARGTVGALAMLDKPMTFNQSCYGIRAKENESTNDYIFYLLKDTVNQLLQISHGGVFDTITKATFDEIDISLPPLEEQKAIAEVLSSLDDKIDLLHRQNHTLESLAQTLFRQWFIEEAKEEWEVGKLGDYIDIVDNRGKTPPISDDITKYPIIEVNALSGDSRLVNYSVIKKHVTEDVYNSWFRAGHPKLYDTLLSTVGSIGEIAMFLLEKGSIAQNVVALRAKNISPFYLYENIKFMQNELKELDIGSVQPSIKVTHLVKIDFVKPDDDILKKFDEQMIDISNKVIVNTEQIQILENLRDTLLPKLLSGEVRVEI